MIACFRRSTVLNYEGCLKYSLLSSNYNNVIALGTTDLFGRANSYTTSQNVAKSSPRIPNRVSPAKDLNGVERKMSFNEAITCLHNAFIHYLTYAGLHLDYDPEYGQGLVDECAREEEFNFDLWKGRW